MDGEVHCDSDVVAFTSQKLTVQDNLPTFHKAAAAIDSESAAGSSQ